MIYEYYQELLTKLFDYIRSEYPEQLEEFCELLGHIPTTQTYYSNVKQDKCFCGKVGKNE